MLFYQMPSKMLCFNTSVFPEEIASICLDATLIISTIAANAPMGVGTLTSCIQTFVNQVQIMKYNTNIVIHMTKDMSALMRIINVLLVNNAINSNIQNSINNISEDLIIATDLLKEWNEKSKIKKFLTSRNYNGKLLEIRTDIEHTKTTLTLAVSSSINNIQRHIIPKTNKVSVLRTTNNHDINQCMLETNSHSPCQRVATYKLISKAGKDNCKLIYHVCGSCAKNSKHAWWKHDYIREVK